MKTAKFFSVLSIALILLGATTAIAGEKTGSAANSNPPGITYRVIIHSDFTTLPSGTYLIRVSDESGNVVAAPQTWIPGVNIYTFTESVSAIANPGSRRMAKLVFVKGPYIPNTFPVFAPPDVKTGPFLPGQIYLFNLFVKSAVRLQK